MNVRRLLTCLAGLVVVSCVGLVPRPADPEPEVAEATRAPARVDMAAVVRANTRFALRLHASMATVQGNRFVSPFSLSTALNMAAAGARGETLRQMLAVLGLPEGDDPHPALGRLLRQVKAARSRKVELRAASALWRQRGLPLLADYARQMRDCYEAGLQQANFAEAPEEARQAINEWARGETRNRIRALIGPGVLTPRTRLVLTNAVYLKGAWQKTFAADDSREESFLYQPGRTAPVTMMHQTEALPYFEERDLQVLELPFAGGELGMVVLLPRRVDGLADLEKQLTPEDLERWLQGLGERKVAVTLPRFKLTGSYRLEKLLQDIGMKDAFSPRADFGGMDGGREKLSLGAVVHQTFLEVNEEGAEAAAASAVEVQTISLPKMAQLTFRADHPFLFLVRHRPTGSVLFLGRYTDPRHRALFP